MLFAVQSQKAVSAYFERKRILPFGFAEQSDCTPHSHAIIAFSAISI